MALITNPFIVLLDDWEYEHDLEPRFVGRRMDIEVLKEALEGQHRLFGVFGLRSVGKSRLVKELISRMFDDQFVTEDNESNNAPTFIRLDLSNQTSIIHVHANVCAELGEIPITGTTNDNAWILQIISYFKARPRSRFIFFFDNVEHSEENAQLHEGIISLCWHLAFKCDNVKIFITSTTNFTSPRLQNVCFSHELLPLSPSESAELLKNMAPNVDFGECEGSIVKLSEGLPLLISMIANELADDDNAISPQDMVNMLATNRLECLSRVDFYAKEDRIAYIYKKFIERLGLKNRRHLALLGYIPASFDAREAKELLGYQAEHGVKDNVLNPISRRYMLTYDAQTRRYNIQGILRECLEVYFAIPNITEVRKKYVEVFSSVMAELCMKLELSQFVIELPNFQKLLTEVQYTTEEIYPFFITIATTCTELIEQFMFKECDKFYQGCLIMADRYGNDVDKAVVNMAVGSMWTNVKGNLLKGEGYYRQALKVLTPKGDQLQVATAYQHMGFNLHKQGYNVQAVRYLEKCLNISQNGGSKFQRLVQQSLVRLGTTNTILGNYDAAEKYHFTALKRARSEQRKDHPTIGQVLNNIGIFLNEKGDSDNAMTYYEAGLEIRRKNKETPVTVLAMSLSNVANMYRSVKNYDKAHELLDEGFRILESQEMPSRTILALLYDTKGKVFMEQERFREALDVFEKSADIREMYEPQHIVYVETLVHLAIAKKCIRQYRSSEKTTKKVLALKQHAAETMPQNPFIAECYECLADVYRQTGNDQDYSETLEHLQSELCRLETLHICSFNNVKAERVKKHLDDVRERINMIKNKETSP